MPIRTIKTKFYCFGQNNSGGRFHYDKERGIGEVVWIEATDPAHANQRAVDIGLYFDGCFNGLDCDCCGDRWSPAWVDDEGVEDVIACDHWRRERQGHIHFLDGTIAGINVDKKF